MKAKKPYGILRTCKCGSKDFKFAGLAGAQYKYICEKCKAVGQVKLK